MKPTLDAIAGLYAAVLGDHPAPEHGPWLHRWIRHQPALAEVWTMLEQPTTAGPSPLELAFLVFAASSPREHPEGRAVLDDLLELDQPTRALRDHLRTLAADLDPARLPSDRWATEALRVHRLFDQLVASLGAADPVETLDPASFQGVPYEHLVAVCEARLRRLTTSPRDPAQPNRGQLENLRTLLLSHLRRHKALPDLEQRIGQLEAWLHQHDPAADLASWLEGAAAEIRRQQSTPGE